MFTEDEDKEIYNFETPVECEQTFTPKEGIEMEASEKYKSKLKSGVKMKADETKVETPIESPAEIPADKTPELLTLEDCKSIIEATPTTSKAKTTRTTKTAKTEAKPKKTITKRASSTKKK